MKRPWAGILAGLLAVVVAVVCVRLGFWQLDRLDQRRALNASYGEALAHPPLELDAGGYLTLMREPEGVLYRRAVAHGSFEHERELLLRGRTHDGRPGVHVITPLRLHENGRVILVNRGWIPSADAATADPRPFRSGAPQTLTGILQRVPEAADQAAPVSIDLGDFTVQTFRRLDRETIASLIGEEAPGLYLQLSIGGSSAGGAQLPVPIPDPSFDEGSHLGYALQWFSFAGIAIFGFLLVAVVRGRPSQAVREAKPMTTEA
jgi:surfeit locus 1 family protein